MSDRYFIDSNIIVYAHDGSEPEKQRRAQELIFDGMRDETAVISSQVMSEFFVTVTRKIAEPISVTEARHILTLITSLEVIDIDPEIVLRATQHLEEHRLSHWDAMILSAAERAGCSIIYSEDFSHQRVFPVRSPHGEEKDTIRCVNPFLA